MTHWSLPVAIGLTVFLLLGYKVIYGAETTTTTTTTIVTTPVSTVPEYILEIKFQTCHVMMTDDLSNLTDYYGCIEG